MKITMEDTNIFIEWHGVPCRVWRGVTEGGVACDVFVPTLRVRLDRDHSEFDRDLRSLPKPAKLVTMQELLEES
jgi:hypothetical protein